MKTSYLSLSVAMLIFLIAAIPASGQGFLKSFGDWKVAYPHPSKGPVMSFVLGGNYVFYNTGDTIFRCDTGTGKWTGIFSKPADYDLTTFPSFLSLSPDGQSLWAGYTDLENTDSRIFSVDLNTGKGKKVASFPGNFDLVFWGDSVLVSGTNNSDLLADGGIYLLDTTGRNDHRLLIATGGSSAGLAVDSMGRLYYGTSYFEGSNGLYRWDSAQVAEALTGIDALPVGIDQGELLSTLPAGIYDCELDVAGNLVFTMNSWGGTQVLGWWNGTPGSGFQYDTLAVSGQWLGMVKSKGDFTVGEPGNSLFVQAFDHPLADLHSADYSPFLAAPVPDLVIDWAVKDTTVDLTSVFSDPDDPDSLIAKTLVSNSNPEQFEVTVTNTALRIIHDVAAPLKSTIANARLMIAGLSAGKEVQDTVEVSVDLVGGLEIRSQPVPAVYPNPGKGIFHLQYPRLRGASVKVFSLNGELVYSTGCYDPATGVDIRTRSNGAYILKAVKGDRQNAWLILKE